VVRQISKRRQARGERDSGCRRGPAGQRVEEGTGMAEAPVATPARLLLLLLGQQGHKAMGARVRGGREAWSLKQELLDRGINNVGSMD